MTYRTIMVHLDLGADNRAVLAVTTDLARRHESDVIGIAVAQPAPPMGDPGLYGGTLITATMTQLDREQVTRDLATCERQFRDAMRSCKGALEWRSDVTSASLPAYIAEHARAADLIVTGPMPPFSAFDNLGRLNVGALTLRAGRPILLVPPNAEGLTLRQVLVAWKDTREARRAVADAMPLLLEAENVTVLAVAEIGDLKPIQARVEDVARWLGRHGVKAVPEAVLTNAEEIQMLGQELASRAPDLVVAGAYGHSRLNEWVLGGVTRNLLLKAGCCVLLSH